MRRLILLALLAGALTAPAIAQESTSVAQQRASLLAAARAALAAGQGALARRHAALLLWHLEPPAEEARAARLIVIDSYVAERQGEPAFRAMLRFQQDHTPLDRAIAERFVEQLLELNLEQHAVNWLAGLDDLSPLKLLLRLRAGLATGEAVVIQARAALAKGGGAAYWRVVEEVARRQRDSLLRIEALEQLLDSSAEGERKAAASELWKSYLAGALEAANRTQLLTGDDAGWADHAARQLATDPRLARALYAYLVQRGSERATRGNAELQLVHALEQARLDRAALWLFGDGDAAALDAQARYLLGAMAERVNLPALAVRYWNGLATPPGVSPEEWQARLAAVHWRNGMSDAALALLRNLLVPGKTLTGDAVKRVAAVAQEMAADGKLEQADGVLRGLLPATEPRASRDVLFALGRVAEGGMRFDAAAEYYLRSAMLADGRTPDALAVQARLAAALSLAQAGNREDARAHFQWVLRYATDPAQRDIARRALSKL
jgi:hypothetical protein